MVASDHAQDAEPVAILLPLLPVSESGQGPLREAGQVERDDPATTPAATAPSTPTVTPVHGDQPTELVEV